MEIYKTLAKEFVVVNLHESNNVCYGNTPFGKLRKVRTPAIETALVNKRLIKVKKPTRSFVWNKLNSKDQPTHLKCY